MPILPILITFLPAMFLAKLYTSRLEKGTQKICRRCKRFSRTLSSANHYRKHTNSLNRNRVPVADAKDYGTIPHEYGSLFAVERELRIEEYQAEERVAEFVAYFKAHSEVDMGKALAERAEVEARIRRYEEQIVWYEEGIAEIEEEFDARVAQLEARYSCLRGARR